MTRPSAALKKTAHHEAGHAVLSYCLGVPVSKVTIVPDEADGTLGHCAFLRASVLTPAKADRTLAWRDRVERRVMVWLAGVLAEARYAGRHRWIGARTDLNIAEDWLRDLLDVRDNEVGPYFKWLLERTRSEIENPIVWAEIEAVAAALIAEKTLTGKRVRAIANDARDVALHALMPPITETCRRCGAIG